MDEWELNNDFNEPNNIPLIVWGICWAIRTGDRKIKREEEILVGKKGKDRLFKKNIVMCKTLNFYIIQSFKEWRIFYPSHAMVFHPFLRIFHMSNTFFIFLIQPIHSLDVKVLKFPFLLLTRFYTSMHYYIYNSDVYWSSHFNLHLQRDSDVSQMESTTFFTTWCNWNLYMVAHIHAPYCCSFFRKVPRQLTYSFIPSHHGPWPQTNSRKSAHIHI